jgi:hypothetical protein
VEDRQDRQRRPASGPVGKIAYDVQHLEPVVQVEVARRLVEKQHARVLRQSLRERETLQVASRQGVDRFIRERCRVGELQRTLDRRLVRRAHGTEPRHVRMPAHLYIRATRETEGIGRRLGQDSHQPRQVALRVRTDIPSRCEDLSAQESSRPGDRAEQRRLARPVRPDQTDDLAGYDGERRIPYDGRTVAHGR